MKRTLIILVVGLLAIGCGKTELTEEEKLGQADADVSIPTTNTNEVDGTTVKPVKELTLEEKRVIGTYEVKVDGETFRDVYLENGVVEGYVDDKKDEEEGKWSISKEGELHFIYENGDIVVFRINKDGSITIITYIDKDGEREDYPKEDQHTYK